MYERKNNNRLLNDINAERKRLVTDIRSKMNDLDFDSCVPLAEKLRHLMQNPAIEGSEDKIKRECRIMVSCFLDAVKAEKLRGLTRDVTFLKGHAKSIPLAELARTCGSMTESLADLTQGRTNLMFLREIEKSVNKIRRHVQKNVGVENDVTGRIGSVQE